MKSKIQVPANSMPGEGPLPGVWKAPFLLCPHTVKTEIDLSICVLPYLSLASVTFLITGGNSAGHVPWKRTLDGDRQVLGQCLSSAFGIFCIRCEIE